MNAVDEIIKTWAISNVKELSLSKSTILSGTFENDPVTLKVFDDPAEFNNQKAALTLLPKNCCPSLIKFDNKLKALLIEEIRPGNTLKQLAKQNENEATLLFCQLLKKMYVKTSSSTKLPTVKGWLSSIQGNAKLSHETLVAAGKAIKFTENYPQETCILHGDLHHENIVYSQDKGWVAIDPKGVIGFTGFETAIFLLNPINETPNLERLFNRLAILHQELNLDPILLKNLAFLRAVLGFIWDVEENNSSEATYWNTWIEILQDCIR
ncbi:MAG: hypothetical protein FJZ57_01315 [Chlamydiae bacterium]|nr:hypothetical protein [Chlamydiota bacterium]